GVVPVALAALPLLFPRTRRVAVVLWAQVVAWVGVVALNGQVRWQNERYVMPAVAWLLVLAALGAQVAFRARAVRLARGRRLFPRAGRVAVGLGARVVAWVGVVALSGQVRWQTARYVMPAVAWVLVLAALGAQVAFRARAVRLARGRRLRPSLAVTVVVFAL